MLSEEQEAFDNSSLESLRDVYRDLMVTVGSGERCLEGTREDVITDIMDWAKDPNSTNLLWLNAMPGAGKTTVARTAVDRLTGHFPFVISFFFRRDNAVHLTPHVLLCHILYSLASGSATFKEVVLNLLREVPHKPVDSQPKDISRIIIQTLQKLHQTGNSGLMPVIVVDALDECSQNSSSIIQSRKTVLDFLSQWQELALHCKLIVTSREEPDIFKVLEKPETVYKVVLHAGISVSDNSSNDIRHYLTSQLCQVNIGHNGIEKLVIQAAGLFVWARTAVDYISGPYSRKRLNTILGMGLMTQKSGLTALDQLYQLVLDVHFSDLDGSDYNLFQHIVGAIITAEVPLTYAALVELLVDKQAAPNSVTKQDIDETLHHLAVLLSASTTGNCCIQFSHLSFPEFIIRKDIYGFSKHRAETYMATRCLLVMNRELTFNICHLPSSYFPNSHYPIDFWAEKYVSGALKYASAHWTSHLVHAGSLTLETAVESFLYTNLLHWLELMSILKMSGRTTNMLYDIATLFKVIFIYVLHI
jgi:hypothetical protein